MKQQQAGKGTGDCQQQMSNSKLSEPARRQQLFRLTRLGLWLKGHLVVECCLYTYGQVAAACMPERSK